MPATEIRKIVTFVEETRTEMGIEIDPPARQCAAVAVIKNYAGQCYSETLPELEAAGAELGNMLGRRAMDALQISADQVQSFGKAAIIGEAGEKEEHAQHVCIQRWENRFALSLVRRLQLSPPQRDWWPRHYD